MHPWARDGVILFNLLMAGVDALVLWHLYRSRTAAAWWRAGVFAAAASFFLVSLFTFGPSVFSRATLHGYRAFPVVRMVAYVLFVHGPICLVGGTLLLRKTAHKTALLSAVGAMVTLGVAIDAFWIEPIWLEVTHLRIASPRLDHPMRVAVLADLQTDVAGRYERRVFERLAAEKPDLILLAGDYVQLSGPRRDVVVGQLNAMMREVGLAAPEGVFAVQGNIDMGYRWTKLFEGLPVVPVNATQSFDVGPLRLTCLAVYDSFNFRLRLAREDPDRFHLVLGHSPDCARGRIDADLLVAGHTHGGQVRVPLVGPLTTGCSVPRDWAAGVTDLPGGAKLVVSRGVGMERGDSPRLRFFCRPELVIIDLVPK